MLPAVRRLAHCSQRSFLINQFKRRRLRYSGVWVGIGWLLVATIVYLSLATIDVDVHVANGDKYGHVAAYAVAAFWFMQLYKSGRSRLIIAFGLALLGVG